eukprot:4917822-Amphidinium_carterae.1
MSIQGGLPNRSTFDVVAQSSSRWCIAQAQDKPHCELALDCSRCFDTLDVASLCDVAILKGFLPEVFVAFRELALTHERILTLQGWKGQSTTPKRGLPQGDGLSVVLAILWGWALQQCASAGGSSVHVMVYLDDVSISAESAGDVAKAFALAATFLWAWGVQLNPAKSSVACIGQTDRAPVSMLELQRVSSFKLL